ncbi:MAG: hypothetical protein M1480_08525 [Bacteroidetes bacterium]|nr:hypothetical protein [Bacteroidota bacterium]
MEISAEIKGVGYTPFLCRELKEFPLKNLKKAFNSETAFIVELDKNNKFAVSWWVSAKRTRSYPYARVYDTLAFAGKKVTVIPVYKDEGLDGDRDYIQWDTISLMSLLGIYVIIAFYKAAKQSNRYKNKITGQEFDIGYIKSQLILLSNYQSDALHWNLSQIDSIGNIAQKALNAYNKISKDLGVKMHSHEAARRRIQELNKSKNDFMNFSRSLANQAQTRESLTTQPKENVSGEKGIVTIKNYLGGIYFFTADEIELEYKIVNLIEAKHSKTFLMPSVDDIKDGLLKMILFTNISRATLEKQVYKTQAVLKLTAKDPFDENKLDDKRKALFKRLVKESERNNFILRMK